MNVRIVVFLTIFISAFFGASALANASVVLGNPTPAKAMSAADYATEVWNDPWDMSNSEDIWPVYTNISGASFANGQFSGTAVNGDPHLSLLWGGYPGSLASARDGIKEPIDTSKYKYMTIKMYSSTDGNAQIYWFYNQDTTIQSESRNFKVYSGWHIYALPFDSYMEKRWTGKPIGLRLDPINAANARFIIDWFYLGASSNDSIVNIPYSNAETQQIYTVYAGADQTDTTDRGQITQFTPSSATGTLPLNLQSIGPGTHYIYLKKGTTNDSNYMPVQVNQIPAVTITEPDLAGGRDWATNVLGDPWDMSNSSDVVGFQSLTARGFKNGYFTAVNVGGKTAVDDPAIFVNLKGKKINTGRYHRVSIRYRYDGSFNLVRGTMARFGWKNYPSNRGWQQTDDMLTYDGWNTLTYDLKGAALDVGNYGWRNYATSLRFDPHEDPFSRRFYVDDIKVAADDAVENGSFNINYNVSDADNSSTSLSLYADPDKTPGNGNETLISSFAPAIGAGSYNWKPATTLNGSYYILAQVNDGLNSNYSYSGGTVLVDNFAPIISTRRSTVKRVSEKKKAARFFKLYKAYNSKAAKAKDRKNKKRYARLAAKYKKAYKTAKTGIAKAYLRWYVRDPYSQNEAIVKLVLQKKIKSKSKAIKKARYKRKYLAYKSLSKKATISTLKRRYVRVAKRYLKAYRATKIYAYKTTKVVNFGRTDINRWHVYGIKTRNIGTYKFRVYARDGAGNPQRSYGLNWLVIK